VFLSWDGPKYRVSLPGPLPSFFTSAGTDGSQQIAFITHLGCYSLLVIALFGFRWYLVQQNKKRDELAAAGVSEARDTRLTHAFEDLTDRENPNFRYVY
jgi:hypothetical protein